MTLSFLVQAQNLQNSANSLLKQMIAVAADNGGAGHTEELNNLKQQIEALPKPARGDKKAARIANEQGLAAFSVRQYEQAKQSFLSAYQADPASAEIAGNLGLTYNKLGDLKAAVKTLAVSLALAPGRASTWADLAEYYALQGQQREAIACYALTFHFSQNRDKTRNYLQNKSTSIDDPKVQQAAQQALQLSLIKGSDETVAAAPVEDSLDAPLSSASTKSEASSTSTAPSIATPPTPPSTTRSVVFQNANTSSPPVVIAPSQTVPTISKPESKQPAAASTAPPIQTASPVTDNQSASATTTTTVKYKPIAQIKKTDQPSQPQINNPEDFRNRVGGSLQKQISDEVDSKLSHLYVNEEDKEYDVGGDTFHDLRFANLPRDAVKFKTKNKIPYIYKNRKGEWNFFEYLPNARDKK